MTVVLSGTISNIPVVTRVYGSDLAIIAALTFSGTYKTGGDETLLPLLESIFKQQGRGTVEWVDVKGPVSHYAMYDFAAGKLKFIVAATGVELAEAAYPAGITGASSRLLAIGR